MNNKADSEIVGKVPASGPAKSPITLKVNGAEKRLEGAPWTTLLDLLREFAAAIANAILHATGKRVRDLPITLDKLL